MTLLGVVLASETLALLFSLLFAARAAAQVPPLHFQLAPMGLLVVMLASVTLALLFSLLFAAMAAAQVPPLHVQLAPTGLLGVMLASVTLALVYSRCSSRRGRRPRWRRCTSSLRPRGCWACCLRR